MLLLKLPTLYPCVVRLKQIRMQILNCHPAFSHKQYTYSMSSCWSVCEYSSKEILYFISFLANSIFSFGGNWRVRLPQVKYEDIHNKSNGSIRTRNDKGWPIIESLWTYSLPFRPCLSAMVHVYVCYYSHLPRLVFFGVQCPKSCQLQFSKCCIRAPVL